MKRITLLLTFLLCLIGGGEIGNAQTYTFKKFASESEAVTDLSTIQDGGYYALKNVGQNAFIKISTSRDKFLARDGALTADDHSDGLAVFKIHIVNDGSDGTTKLYTFESALTGSYMPAPRDGQDHFVEAAESPVTFEIRTLNSEGNKYSNNGVEDGNDIFYIKNSADNGNGAWFDMQPARFVGWQGKGANARYQIIPVTVSDEDVTFRMITHHMTDADGNSFTDYPAPFEAKFYEDGTELNTNILTSYYYPVTLQNESNITGEGNTEFAYSIVKGTAPVDFSTADNKTWYRIQIENAGTRTLKAIFEDDVYHVFTQESAFNTTGLENYEGFRKAVWSFIEAGTGVKVYNKGTDKYLKWESGCAQLVDGENNATTFYITQNTANNNRGFGLWTGTGNNYLNASVTYGGTVNARLGVWNNNDSKNDPGSCFIVADIDLNSDLLTVGKDLAKTAINAVTVNEVDETYVTANTQNDIDRLIQGVTDATNLDQIEADYTGINKPFCDINPKAVYRIGCIAISADKKKYASVNSMPVGKDGSLGTAYSANTGMDRKVYRVPASADYMSQLWLLVPQENNTFKIRSANVDRCWCNNVSDNVDIPITKGTGGNYTFEIKPDLTAFGNGDANSSPSTTFLLSLNGKYVNAFNGDNADYIKNYQDENGKGCYWQIEKVTSIPVTVSAAGYASVGYPFAVQVPEESGVKAYYGKTAENGKLYLEEITGGLIPANTGAVLVKEGGATLNLDIVTTEVTAIEGNKLQAATAKRTGFTANENYLLGVDNDNTVKFLVATITTVPANKAFLPATEVPTGTMAPALAFDFGNATGIGNVINREEKDVEYYDLNGRRVLYPANGVFVTNNGRKVLIK